MRGLCVVDTGPSAGGGASGAGERGGEAGRA